MFVVKTWAISGVDLHLDLTGTRVRAELETALRDAVRTGRLRPGTRLPASRGLAADLGIARNTVADAYGQLVAEGWLVARQGAGTRVADRAPAPERPVAARPVAEPGPRHQLVPGFPDTAAFPRTAWLAAARRALTAAPSDAFGYTDPRGRPELRVALADYLARVRGVRADPDRIMVCAGFTQGLALLCRVLAARGETHLAMEAYGHLAHRDVVAAAGLEPDLLDVDADGARVDQLRRAAVLLTPAHQFPLGVALASERRAAVVARVAERGGVVIEDDYDGEFRYDRQPVGAVQALDPEHVVYAGTASKTLAPGLRLGWLVLPERLLADVLAAKTHHDVHSGVTDQLTLAELITSGGYDRHVRRMRLIYRRRRDRLVTLLARRAPDVRVTGIAAGLQALVTLPDKGSEDAVVAEAAARGVAVNGLAMLRRGGPPRPAALVVGYGSPPEHRFTTAISRLAAALELHVRRPGRGIIGPTG
jgi:GntR family transcriptional regulator / MocR family aminotransferase